MTIKSLLETTFPALTSTYRRIRDSRKAAAWRASMTPLGFKMVGVDGMAESRLESGELPLLLERLNAECVFVDVGANCGVFTLAARQAGATCIAVEPHPDNLQALLINLQANRFTDVEVFPVALSLAPNLQPLFGGGEGASLEKNWGGMRGTYSTIVPVNTLDHLMGGRFLDRQLVIKIDVEGHELDVLRGATGLMQRDPAPDWLLEHGFRENYEDRINPHFRGLFDLFWQRGYQSVTADSERRPVTPDDVERWLENEQRDFGYLNYWMTKS